MFEDIKPGRIKGSVNIPIYLLIDPNTKQMKCVDAIREVFKDAAIDLDNTHVVATCGCGEFSALFVRVDPRCVCVCACVRACVRACVCVCT